MSLQINCPFCQMLLAIDPRVAGHQVQCPSCQQLFAVAPPPVVPPVVPVAQARHVVPVQTPAPQRPAPGQAAPRAAPGPATPRSAPGGARPAPQAAKKQEASSGLAVALMIGLVVLGLGAIGGGVYFVNNTLKKRQLAEKGLGSEIKSQLEARRAAAAKVKKEEMEERDALLAGLRKFLTDRFFEGNEKAAGEIMREIDAVNAEADRLFSDADADNDPRDMRAFLAERLEPRLRSNPVLFNWLGGRLSPKDFCAMLFGQEREGAKARGKVADFLTAGNYAGTGTGFYITNDGWLLTNQHVVRDATEVDVRGPDGVIRRAAVVKTDVEGDVALLKTKEAAPRWLGLGTTEATMGAAVFTVGFPDAEVQGVEPKFTDGRVSSLSGLRDDPEHYQITVPVQPGNSGGPLVDAKTGVVVGIVAAVLRGRENVTYAIKSRVAAALLKTVPAFPASLPGRRSQRAEIEALAADVRAATVLVMVGQ
ncbi:MAG: S1 family peptidase [Prosthecobacter sp.]